jgi:hypothetical protein
MTGPISWLLGVGKNETSGGSVASWFAISPGALHILSLALLLAGAGFAYYIVMNPKQGFTILIAIVTVLGKVFIGIGLFLGKAVWFLINGLVKIVTILTRKR